MNIVNIFDEIEKADGEIYERLSPRRKAMKDFFRVGSKVAIAAVPFGLGAMFNKAYGQTPPAGVIAVLQYALTLEHFEANFIQMVIIWCLYQLVQKKQLSRRSATAKQNTLLFFKRL